MKIKVGETPPGTQGHICSDTRAVLFDEDGDVVGYLTPYAADKARRGLAHFETEEG